MRRSSVRTRGFWVNRWEAAKREWRRQPPKEWSAAVLPHGLRIEMNSWAKYRGGWRHVAEVDWSEIVKVVAYKTDDFSVDTIWLDFELKDGDSVALPEDASEWKQLATDLPKFLAGCLTLETWYARVSQPPFETNHTVLYSGSSDEAKAS